MAEDKKDGISYVSEDGVRETDEAKTDNKNTECDGHPKRKSTVKKIHNKIHELEEMVHKVSLERDEL